MSSHQYYLPLHHHVKNAIIMATITLTLSKKSDAISHQHEILMEFWHGQKIHQRAKTNIFVHRDYWNDETQSVVIPNWHVQSEEREQLFSDLRSKSERLSALMALVQTSFQSQDKYNVPNHWLKSLIHEFNFPTTSKSDTPNPKHKKSFFDWFELFLTTKNYPHGSTKSFRVLERALGRYEGYKRHKNKNFTLDIDTMTKDTIEDFFKYFENEHLLATKHKRLFERLLREYPSEITQKHKTGRISQRGSNHITNLQKKFKRFFLWLNKEGHTTNRPFDGFEIKGEKYGTPIILTLEERNKIADFDLSSKPHLERQRDVFIFQYLIGCRVGDLLKMTPYNVVDGQIEYIPRKTKDDKPVTVEVPLNARAVGILSKYRDTNLSSHKSKVNDNPLLPFISSQKYNEAIKEIFRVCGINRMVVVIDPVTGEQLQKPLHEVASSHLARRTFIGLLYNQILDPNLISSMSGHVEGSREFARYRKIEREAKKKAVDLIN